MGGCCESGYVKDKDVFVLKIGLEVLYPDIRKTKKIEDCEEGIRREAKDYINSLLLKMQIRNEINKIVRNKTMILNVNTVVYDNKSEIKVFGEIEILDKRSEWIPTYLEFEELLKQVLIDSLRMRGYPNKMYKKYLGITDKDYKIVFEEGDIIVYFL